MEKLKERLKNKPDDLGKWTGPKVARWIEKEIGIEKVWNQRGWEYLKKCEYSWQRPRPKHRKGDKKAQEEFKKDLPELVERLKKQYPNAEIEVWCLGWLDMARKPRRLPTASLMSIEWD